MLNKVLISLGMFLRHLKVFPHKNPSRCLYKTEASWKDFFTVLGKLLRISHFSSSDCESPGCAWLCILGGGSLLHWQWSQRSSQIGACSSALISWSRHRLSPPFHCVVVLMNRHLNIKEKKNPQTHTHTHHKICTKLHFIMTENTSFQVVTVLSLGFWVDTGVC